MGYWWFVHIMLYYISISRFLWWIVLIWLIGHMQKLELSMDLDPIHCWLGYPVPAEIVELVPINVKRKNVKCKKKYGSLQMWAPLVQLAVHTLIYNALMVLYMYSFFNVSKQLLKLHFITGNVPFVIQSVDSVYRIAPVLYV